jgi:hypothetical protein
MELELCTLQAVVWAFEMEFLWFGNDFGMLEVWR